MSNNLILRYICKFELFLLKYTYNSVRIISY